MAAEEAAEAARVRMVSSECDTNVATSSKSHIKGHVQTDP